MSTTILKNLYIIAENSLDVQILRTILNCEEYNAVYDYGVSGYHSMANVCRTLRLMIGNYDKILIAFDTGTRNKEAIEDISSSMVFLTKADVSRVAIGLFPMVPNFNVFFGIREEMRNNVDMLREHLKAHIDTIRSNQKVVDMQNFLNS